MEVIPPLNLSTCVKVETFPEEEPELEPKIPVEGDLIHHQDGDENFVILQNAENNESQVLTITGEVVEEPQPEDLPPSDGTNLTKLDKVLKEEVSDKLYQCSHCDKEFVRASLLRNHEKNHIQDKVLACELCPQTFNRLSLLICHRQEHNKNPIHCPTCDVPITSYTSYRAHMRKHRGDKKFKCSACPMRFIQNSHLTIHMRKHTGEKPFACSICKTSFKQMSHLTTHLRTHTNDKPYVCDICDAAFSQTGSLKRHKRSHTGEKPFQCDKCQAVFVEKRNLTRHLLSHSGIRPFKCDQCDASFTQYIDLKRHKFSHSGIKPFKCDVCEAAFSRKNNLKWHKLTHEGETPHKCEVCNVGFRIMRDLKNHRRVHGENKPYSCDLCKASFTQITNLKRHILLHSGNRSHVCDKCGASFFEKSALKRHLMRHNGIKKYGCDACNATFIESRALRRHKIIVHNDGNYEDLDAKGGAIEAKKEVTDIDAGLDKATAVVLPSEENSLHIFDPSYQRPLDSSVVSFADGKSILQIASRPTEVSTQTLPNVIGEATQHNSEQGPTLLLTTPGQPIKTGRPALDCQNHLSHIHTLVDGEYGQLQTWCFCETPNIPSGPDPLRAEAPISEPQIENMPSSMISASTHSGLSYGTPVISQAAPVGRALPQPDVPNNSMSLLRESLEGRLQGMPIEQQQMQEQSKPHSLQHEMTPLFHEMSQAHSNYPQVSQFQSYEPQFSNQVSSNQHTILSEDQSHEIIHTPLNSQLPSVKTSFSTIDDISLSDNNVTVTFTSSSKKGRPLSKEDKSKVVPRELTMEKDMEVTHILPHDLNAAPFSQHSQLELPRISHISSLASHQEGCQEVQGNGLHFDDGHQISLQEVQYKSFPQVDYPNPQLNQQEQMLPPKGVEEHQSRDQIEATYEHINSKPVLQRDCHPHAQLQSTYEKVSQSDTLNASNAKDQIHLQYSLTVNNPAAGNIQIQSDAFPAKPDLPVKPPLKKRRMQKQMNKEEKQFICSHCGRIFHKQTQLDLHVRTHTGEKPFICGVCHQSFAHNNSLTVHMRCHTGERPYSCIYCSATFTQKSNLRVHHRTHTGERPFKCDTCEASFSQGSHLTAHKRIHNNDRPYACLTCGHAFTQKSALKRHEIKHSGTKPHKCDICNTQFLHKEDHRRHRQLHMNSKKRLKHLSKNRLVKKIKKEEPEMAPENSETPKEDDDSPREVEKLPARESTSNESSPETCRRTLVKESLESPTKDSNKVPLEKADKQESETTEGANGEETNGRPRQVKQEMKVEELPMSASPTPTSKSYKRAKVQEPTRSSKRIREAAAKRKFKDYDSDFITGDLNEIDAAEQLEEQAFQISRKNAARKKDSPKPDPEVVHSWCFCEVPHGPNEPHTHAPQLSSYEAEPSLKRQEPLNKDSSLHYCGSSSEDVLQLSLAPLSQALVLHGDQPVMPPSNVTDTSRSDPRISMPDNNMMLSTTEMSNGSQVMNSSLPVINAENVAIDTQVIAESSSLNEAGVIEGQSMPNDEGRAVYNTAQIISSQVLPGGQYITQDGALFIEAAEINFNNGAVLLNSSSGAFFLDISSDGQLLNVPIGSGNLQEPVIVTGNADNVDEKYTYAGDATQSIELPSNAITFSSNPGQPNAILEVPRSVTSLRTNTVLQNGNLLPSTSVVASSSDASCVPHLEEVHSVTLANCPTEFLQTKADEKIPLKLEGHDPKATSGILVQAPESHVKSGPSSTVVDPPCCSVCSKVFAQKHTLKQHMEKAHSGLVYCTLCFDAFTSKEHLHAHKAKHKSTYVCADCNTSFSSKRAVNKHRQKVHNLSGTLAAKKDQRPFSCNQCESKFLQYSDLKRHILGHSGIKPYKCKHCGACFTRKSSLNKHERIHTGEKPYKCKKCDQAFAYRYQFNRHKGCWCT